MEMRQERDATGFFDGHYCSKTNKKNQRLMRCHKYKGGEDPAHKIRLGGEDMI